jgi:hypothetical protein
VRGLALHHGGPCDHAEVDGVQAAKLGDNLLGHVVDKVIMLRSNDSQPDRQGNDGQNSGNYEPGPARF